MRIGECGDRTCGHALQERVALLCGSAWSLSIVFDVRECPGDRVLISTCHALKASGGEAPFDDLAEERVRDLGLHALVLAHPHEVVEDVPLRREAVRPHPVVGPQPEQQTEACQSGPPTGVKHTAGHFLKSANREHARPLLERGGMVACTLA